MPYTVTTPGTCTASLSFSQSSSPTSHTLFSELQPCADLRNPLSGALAETPSFTLFTRVDTLFSMLETVSAPEYSETLAKQFCQFQSHYGPEESVLSAKLVHHNHHDKR